MPSFEMRNKKLYSFQLSASALPQNGCRLSAKHLAGLCGSPQNKPAVEEIAQLKRRYSKVFDLSVFVGAKYDAHMRFFFESVVSACFCHLFLVHCWLHLRLMGNPLEKHLQQNLNIFAAKRKNEDIWQTQPLPLRTEIVWMHHLRCLALAHSAVPLNPKFLPHGAATPTRRLWSLPSIAHSWRRKKSCSRKHGLTHCNELRLLETWSSLGCAQPSFVPVKRDMDDMDSIRVGRSFWGHATRGVAPSAVWKDITAPYSRSRDTFQSKPTIRWPEPAHSHQFFCCTVSRAWPLQTQPTWMALQMWRSERSLANQPRWNSPLNVATQSMRGYVQLASKRPCKSWISQDCQKHWERKIWWHGKR